MCSSRLQQWLLITIVSGTIVSFSWLAQAPPASAQDYGSTDDMVFDSDLEVLDNPYRPADEQKYLPNPPLTPPPAPQKKTPWYKKLMKPVKKNASLPINLVPKYPAGPKKSPPPSADPLLRLQRAFVFEGQVIEPGFYLLSIETESEDRGWIVLTRNTGALVRIPALSSSAVSMSMMSMITDSNSQTPPDEERTSYFKPDDSQLYEMNDKAMATKPKEARDTKVKDTPPVIRTAVSEDQNFLMLIYTDTKRQLQTIPLPMPTN